MKNLRARIESALVAYLDTVGAPLPLSPGQTDAALPDECIVVVAENSSHESPLMGRHANASVRVVAMIRTNSNDTAPTVHQEHAEAVRYALTDVLALRASLAAESVHLYDFWPETCDEAVDGDRFATAFSYTARVVDNPAVG